MDETLKRTANPLVGWHRYFLPAVSLLYTVFWFIRPWRSHSLQVWVIFALFYAVFLLAYGRLVVCDFSEGRWWLGVLFVIGYLYYPFNYQAIGETVYPVVLCAYVLRQPSAFIALRYYMLIMAAQLGAAYGLTWALHLSMQIPQTLSFSMVTVGLCNFAYARQQMLADQLHRANDEIKHLTQVAERERIARDLHDLLGHTLTTIVLKTDVANRLFTREPAIAQQEMLEVEATARKALAEVREAVSGYRGAGLAAEIAHARRVLTSGGVQLSTSLEPVELDLAEADTLCLVLREAVTNIVRHSGATACRLELLGERARLRMTIEDNGSGQLGIEGNGTAGMRERLAAVGGVLLRETIAAGGLRLIAEVPRALPRPRTDSDRPRHAAATAPRLPSEHPVNA